MSYVTILYIYVREKVNEKWGSYSLVELPSELSITHVLRFIKEGTIPHRVISEEE
jgi:hypothetical protein